MKEVMKQQVVKKPAAIFLYERHDDPSAAQVLKELVSKISGNASLCLEMSDQNIKETLVATGRQTASNYREAIALRKDIAHKGISSSKNIWYYKSFLNIKSAEDLSPNLIGSYLDFIALSKQKAYENISVTLCSVKFAESKGMKVYAIDQPYSERPSQEDEELYDRSRDSYMANKLIRLCDTTDEVVLFLVGLEHHRIAKMVREKGIVTKEYYISTNADDQFLPLSHLNLPSSVKLISLIDFQQDVVKVRLQIMEDAGLLVQEAEKSKEESHDSAISMINKDAAPSTLDTTSSESTVDATHAVSTVVASLSSSAFIDMTTEAHNPLTSAALTAGSASLVICLIALLGYSGLAVDS